MNVCNIGWNSTPSMSPDKTKLCFHDINGLFKVIMLDKLEENIIYRNCHHSVYGLWSVSSDKILFENFGDIFIYDVFEDRCNYIDCGTNPQWLGDCLNVIYLHKGKIIKYDVLTKEKKQIFFDEKEKCGLRAASDGSIISYFTTDTYDNDNVKKEITLNMLHVYSKEIVKTSNFGNVRPETETWSTNS